MNEATYRNATAADAAGIRALWREFWSEQPYEVNLEAKIRSDPDLVIVAEAEGRIVGTVIGGWDGWWAWVYRLAVSKSHQKAGLGATLLRTVRDRLIARGADAACAVVSPDNVAVHRLFGKLDGVEKPYRILVVRKPTGS